MANLNMGEAYIMNADKTGVDDQMGANKLYREGLEFDTRAKTGVLTEDMPKKQTKATVEASLFSMAEQRDY
jgi:hypothetical protein|tara:strand:- start:504 stop:716 length:213 start_codon:yes stop_codon:yes gene_type:complete